MPKKILKGKVISDKNKKTIVVLVERKYQHPFLKKIVKIVHPEIRSRMNSFIKKNKKKKTLGTCYSFR